MRTITLRLLFAGLLAIMALGGALALEAMGHECPVWLVATVATAVGYIFGQVHENGVTLGGGKPTPPA